MPTFIACQRNQPFADGYVIQTNPARLADGLWRESFNSDAVMYGGQAVGNFAAVPVRNGRIQVRVRANGMFVFQNL